MALYKQSAATAMDGAVEEALVLGRRRRSRRSRHATDRAEALEWHSLHHYWLDAEARRRGGPPGDRGGHRAFSVYGVVNGHGDLGLSLTYLAGIEEALEVFARRRAGS